MATNNPLTIHVDLEWDQHPSNVALREQGHTVNAWEPLGVDLTISKKAWNWNDSMWPYLDVALKAARKDKPKGVKKDGKQRKSGNRADRNGVGKVSRRIRHVRKSSDSTSGFSASSNVQAASNKA